jgi:hypothetical protein
MGSWGWTLSAPSQNAKSGDYPNDAAKPPSFPQPLGQVNPPCNLPTSLRTGWLSAMEVLAIPLCSGFAGITYQRITLLEELCEVSILICDPVCVAVLVCCT